MRKTGILRLGVPFIFIFVLAIALQATGMASSMEAVWPEASGTNVQTNGKLVIDASNMDLGYVMVRASAPTKHPMKVTVSRGKWRLIYDLNSDAEFDENGVLDQMMTRRALGASLKPLAKAVIAGFYGADMNGRIHTLSRGGSDVTGSLAAAAIQADLYENWTDVPGLLAADPRIVDAPMTVQFVSYRELRTLSYMGASVLHTDAVLPVSDMGIPINIRNTYAPEEAGTMIVRKIPKGEKKYPIIAVAGRQGMSVIQVEKVMVSDESGFTAIMLDILKNRQLPFEQCLTGIDSVTLVIRSDLLEPCKEDLFAEIRETLNPDFLGLKENLSMIAIIGEKGTEASDANVRVLQSLTQENIQISTINKGAGKLNLLSGVPDEKYEEAIRAIYRTIDESMREMI